MPTLLSTGVEKGVQVFLVLKYSKYNMQTSYRGFPKPRTQR